MSYGELNGKHYSGYVDEIKTLMKEKKYEEAEKLLIQIIDVMEKDSIEAGEPLAPWYYDRLAMVYQKTKQKEFEIKILKQYLTHIRKSSGAKIFEKYIKLNETRKVKDLQNEIYQEYLSNLKQSNLKTKKQVCEHCKNEIEYSAPQLTGEQAFLASQGFPPVCFYTSCPFCYNGIAVSY